MDFGHTLRAERESRRLRIVDAARLSGLSASTWANAESGARPVRLITAQIMLDALHGVSPIEAARRDEIVAAAEVALATSARKRAASSRHRSDADAETLAWVEALLDRLGVRKTRELIEAICRSHGITLPVSAARGQSGEVTVSHPAQDREDRTIETMITYDTSGEKPRPKTKIEIHTPKKRNAS